jgi:hypothetical protein
MTTTAHCWTLLAALGLGAGVAATAVAAEPAQAPAPQVPPLPQDPGSPRPNDPELERLKLRLRLLEETVAQERAARELANVGVPAELVEGGSEEPKLQVYGFMDTGLSWWFVADEDISHALPSTAATFLTGNTNLYFDARPTPNWRGLIETRFTLFPHGHFLFNAPGPSRHLSNRIYDTTSPSGRDLINWGSIVLERSQVEWWHSDKLTLIAGLFVTPWGIWNVDHGTPTTISLLLPSFLVQEAIPKQQTGVQAVGSLHLPPLELGYRLFVSNGRTTTQFDFSNDKAIGGRLFLRRMGPLTATLGASGIWGTTQEVEKLVTVNPMNKVAITSKVVWAYSEWTVGADLAVDWGGFRLRSEGVLRRVQFDDGKHRPILTIPGATEPNRFEYYAYVLAAYRWHWLEPYLFTEVGDMGTNAEVVPMKGWTRSVGVNLHLTAAAQLKLQYAEMLFENVSGMHNTHFFVSRLVLAF